MGRLCMYGKCSAEGSVFGLARIQVEHTDEPGTVETAIDFCEHHAETVMAGSRFSVSIGVAK